VTTPRTDSRPAAGAPRAVPVTSELDAALGAVEHQLATLGQALVDQDAEAAEKASAALRTALRGAMEQFARVARQGGVPLELKRRLAAASGQIAAQREALSRATTALDQALDILLPRADDGGTYGAHGGAARSTGRVIAAS
jgi:ABC-type transporter Mla subunit MlaD